MGNEGSWSLIEALGVSATERETVQTNKFMPHRLSLVNTMILKGKLFLPIIPIGIVAYALTLLWDNLCRNSCISLENAAAVESLDLLQQYTLTKQYTKSDF